MVDELRPLALGYSLAILGALGMLILGLLGAMGYAAEAVKIMAAYHIGFSAGFFGILVGMIEAAVFCFVFGYLTAWLYNKF